MELAPMSRPDGLSIARLRVRARSGHDRWACYANEEPARWWQPDPLSDGP
jgi:hypothetical protein